MNFAWFTDTINYAQLVKNVTAQLKIDGDLRNLDQFFRDQSNKSLREFPYNLAHAINKLVIKYGYGINYGIMLTCLDTSPHLFRDFTHCYAHFFRSNDIKTIGTLRFDTFFLFSPVSYVEIDVPKSEYRLLLKDCACAVGYVSRYSYTVYASECRCVEYSFVATMLIERGVE